MSRVGKGGGRVAGGKRGEEGSRGEYGEEGSKVRKGEGRVEDGISGRKGRGWNNER